MARVRAIRGIEHGRASVGARPRAGERGASLIEALVAMVLLALVGLAVLTGLMVSMRASMIHRAAANAEVVTRNFAAALSDAPYVPCAQPADYQSPPGFELPAGYSVQVTSVQGWTGDVNAASFAPFGTGCQSIPIDPAADSSLQQVSFQIRRPADAAGKGAYSRSVTTLKYFDGTTTSSDRIPQNAIRCTIGGSDVSDAVIDQAQPSAKRGTEPTLDVNKGASGDVANAAQSSLIRFNISAGSTTCMGANDTNPGQPLPALSANLVVQRAQLRLYNWRINGAPSCPVECTIALDRPTAGWTEGNVTWSSAPTVNPGRVSFNLAQASGDYSPAFQLITSAGLTADVQSFYGSQSAGAIPNYGWRMSEVCTTSTGCTTQTPGFEFRSHEWKQASQRPTLEIILAPRTTTAVQLRNVGSGLCASLKDDRGGADNQPMFGLTCNGKGYQGWIYTQASKQFMSTASVDNVANRKCIDIQPVRPAGRDATYVWGCTPTASQQQLTFDPSTGTISALQKLTSNGAQVAQCLEVDRSTAPTGGTSPVGTKVFVNDCDGNANQQWSVEPQQGAPPPPSPPVRFRNVKGNSCADIEPGRAGSPPYWRDDSPGVSQLVSRTEQFPCMGSTLVAGSARTSQTWRFDGYDRIINGRDQTACLNAGDGNVNTLVTVDYCSNLAREQWSVETVNGTSKRIRSVLTGNCLEGGYDGHQMRVRVCDANNQRQWWAIESPTGPATAPIGWFRNEGSFNSCMEPQNGGAVAHQAAIWTWPCTSDHPQQEFIRYRVSDTQVQYRPTANLTLCLDTYGGGDGTNLHLYNCWVNDPGGASSASTSQAWTLSPSADLAAPPTPADATARRIVAADSSRCEQAETDGALVVTRTCDANNAYQRWFFEPVGVVKQQLVQFRSAYRADSGCLAPTNKLISASGNTFSGSDTLTTWPCSGALQPAQSFLRLTNGQIRLSPDVSLCLDSNSSTGNAGSTPNVHSPCHLGFQETWRYVEVTGSNPTRQLIQNTTKNVCLSAGLDLANLSMQTCNPADLAQNWYVQNFGTAANPRVGHLRDVDTTNCLEQDQAGGLGNGRWVWAWPCAGDTRLQQRFVLLNNGQIRPWQDLSYCLDDSTGTMTDRNGHMNINGCNSPVSNQQNWGRDVNGVRVAVIGTTNTAQGYPVGLLRNARMAAGAANSCQREIPGPVVRFGTGNLSGLALPNDSGFWKGAYSITRPDCTQAPVANVSWTFEPTSTTLQIQKQVRLGLRSDSGCVEPSSTNSDSTFWSWPCTATTRTAQRFVMQYDSSGNVQIVNPSNGYCMDGRNVAVNDTMYWHECHSDLNQRWTPVPVTDNAPFVRLKNAKSGTNLCIQGDLDTTILKLATCDGGTTVKAQWFVIEDVGATVNARYVQLKNQASNWCLTTASGSISDGRQLTSVDCGASSRNRFLVTNTGQLRAVENLNFCIDHHHHGEGDTYLVLWTCHDQNARDTERSQRWVVPPAVAAPGQSIGSVQNFWDTTKCVKETFGLAQPFSSVACVADSDPNALWQRWTIVAAAGP